MRSNIATRSALTDYTGSRHAQQCHIFNSAPNAKVKLEKHIKAVHYGEISADCPACKELQAQMEREP